MNITGGRKVLLALGGGLSQLLALLLLLRSIERVAMASIGAGQAAPPVDWLTLALLVTTFAVPFVGSAGANAVVHVQRAKYGSAPTNGHAQRSADGE